MTTQFKRAKRAKKRKEPLPFKARARARRAAQPPQPSVPGFERVMPFADWCRYKSISIQTGKRWRKAGKIRTVQLSTNRIGVTESADREFMRECESAAP